MLSENVTVKTIVWSTSDTYVSEANGKGSVIAVRNGEAVITAASTLFPQVKATFMVTVDEVGQAESSCRLCLRYEWGGYDFN